MINKSGVYTLSSVSLSVRLYVSLRVCSFQFPIADSNAKTGQIRAENDFVYTQSNEIF